MSDETGIVLVVEDQPDLVDLFRMMLTEAGFTVKTAMNGDEALDLFKAIPAIEVVIVDYQIPKTTGAEIYRQMYDLRPNTKAIICSGVPGLTLSDMLEPGWRLRLLPKPFNTREMLDTVTELMNMDD